MKDLKLGEKLKILNDPEILLFQVKLPVEEKVEEAQAAPEIEVIREKKEEGDGAAEKTAEESKSKEAAKPDKK